MNRRQLLIVGTQLRKQYEALYKAPLTPAMLSLIAQIRAVDAQLATDLTSHLDSTRALQRLQDEPK
jgi:hypothetical protein